MASCRFCYRDYDILEDHIKVHFTDLGIAASAAGKADSYDLLLLDIAMTRMDGFTLYEKIRKIDNEIKVFFTTAFAVNYEGLRERNVKVRILMPADKSTEQTVQNLKQNYPEYIDIRYVEATSSISDDEKDDYILKEKRPEQYKSIRNNAIERLHKHEMEINGLFKP